MAAHVALVNAVQTLLDADGDPVVGGKIYTYSAGTSTPVATYFESDLDVSHQNTNPIVTNSAGRWTCFPPQGVSVKLVILDATDVLLYTIDGLAPADVVD